MCGISIHRVTYLQPENIKHLKRKFLEINIFLKIKFQNWPLERPPGTDGLGTDMGGCVLPYSCSFALPTVFSFLSNLVNY